MDESLQQFIALGLVVIAVAAELLRRHYKKKSRQKGCDGCDTGKPNNSSDETPLQFYKRSK